MINFTLANGSNLVICHWWCHNLLYNGSVDEKPKESLPKRKTCGSRHQRLFEENVRKTKKRSENFENKDSGVFTHGEGISTPHTRHKGRQSLIECVKTWLQNCVFFLFIFLGSTRVLPRILRCDEEFRPI